MLRLNWRAAGVLLAVAGAAAGPLAAQSGGVAVLVVDEHHRPLEGAQGQVGDLLADSGRDGLLYLLGLEPGRRQLTVQLNGYHPELRNVEVTAGPPVPVTVVLHPVRRGEPVEVRPTASPGARGVVVGENRERIAGAEVHWYGREGRMVRTDNDGVFEHPAVTGPYLVRVAAPGHRERRFGLVVPEGEGRVMRVELVPADTSYRGTGNAQAATLQQMGRRLAAFRPRRWLTKSDLSRFGTHSLCTIPQVAAAGRGARTGEMPGLMDGERSINICTLRAHEVELVELANRILVWLPQ